MTTTLDDDVIDLRAGRREATRRPPRVAIGGEIFELPLELPASVLDPLFDGELDGIIAVLVDLVSSADVTNPSKTDLAPLFERIRSNPLVIKEALGAARSVFRNLIGPDDWPRWEQTRPGITDYISLARVAWQRYGVGLGEALGLSSSSGGDGQTSKQTSPAVASMRAASGSKARTRN